MHASAAVAVRPPQDALRPMLNGWALHYTPDRQLRRRLVQMTIDTVINNPDLIDKACVRMALFAILHEIALLELHPVRSGNKGRSACCWGDGEECPGGEPP